jgi:DNA gyrase subunit A
VVTREEDAIRILTVGDTHDDLYFFTNRGKVFYLKCYEIPAGSSRTAKGLAVINLITVAENERVTAMIAVTGFMSEAFLVMATAKGEIKRTAVSKFASVRSSGLITMDLEKGDELISACLATAREDVILVTRKGKSIKFAVSEIRASSRTSGGVRAIRLASGDRVVSMDKASEEDFLLVAAEGGLGKLTPVAQYPRQHRGGQGVRTFNIVEKAGNVAAAQVVTQAEQLMIISAEGIVECTPVKGISVQGRSTQGVRVMRTGKHDKVVAIAAFEPGN